MKIYVLTIHPRKDGEISTTYKVSSSLDCILQTIDAHRLAYGVPGSHVPASRMLIELSEPGNRNRVASLWPALDDGPLYTIDAMEVHEP